MKHCNHACLHVSLTESSLPSRPPPVSSHLPSRALFARCRTSKKYDAALFLVRAKRDYILTLGNYTHDSLACPTPQQGCVLGLCPWILPSVEPLAAQLQSLIRLRWTLHAAVPSPLVDGFAEHSDDLLGPFNKQVSSLTGALDKPRTAKTAQALELTDELLCWMEVFGTSGAPGSGATFAESVGSKRDENVRIAGSIVEDGKGKTVGFGRDGRAWDEIALAHYPSIWHFADLLASEDYQEANHKYRIGSLKDTFILCTTELDLPLTKAKRAKL